MPLLLLRLVLVVGALFALPAAARAHAILLDSQPAAGGAVKPGKATLSLRYNSRIDAARSRIALTGPAGEEKTLPIAHGDTPDMLTAETELVPGPYVLRWQVLAVDGHIAPWRVALHRIAGRTRHVT